MSWTFLIIDSNEADANHSARQVQSVAPGCQVLVAGGGGAALALLEERRLAPSLILAEFALADMNGIELLGQVRSRRWLEGTPVAMLSALVDDRHVVHCYRLGACTFLTRPVPAYALRETIRDFARPAEQMSAASVVPGRGGGLPRAA